MLVLCRWPVGRLSDRFIFAIVVHRVPAECGDAIERFPIAETKLIGLSYTLIIA